jgi:hypothetical protein
VFLIKSRKNKFVISSVFFILLFASGCLQPPPSKVYANNSTAVPAKNCSGACIEIKGTVLGDIIPGSKVSLYKVSDLNYSIVMAEIRDHQPLDNRSVNESKGFKFDCLCFGQYALVIPTSFYNGSVGPPLPYEFDCVNISLKISFQGGDSGYMVGAFLIDQPGYNNISRCSKNPLLCIKKRGSLYRECPFMNDKDIYWGKDENEKLSPEKGFFGNDNKTQSPLKGHVC